MEVGSGEKENEVALKHSKCEEDLNLVSSSRVSQLSNAGLRPLSSRVIFTSSFFLMRKQVCARQHSVLMFVFAVVESTVLLLFYSYTQVNYPPLCEISTLCTSVHAFSFRISQKSSSSRLV